MVIGYGKYGLFAKTFYLFLYKTESAGLWHDTRESALGQQGEQAGQVGEPGAGGQATHISNSALRVPRGLSYHTRKSPCRLCSAEPLVSSKPEQQQQV